MDRTGDQHGDRKRRRGPGGKPQGPYGKSEGQHGQRSGYQGKPPGPHPKPRFGPKPKPPGKGKGGQAAAHQGGAQPPPKGAHPPVGTSWEHVAQWYDRLVGEVGSDYHRNVLLPAAMGMLNPRKGQRVMDVCCGQGVLSRMIGATGAQVLGVDISESLIASARARGGGPNVRYEIADARQLGPIADGSFDSAVCLMAVHDLDNLDAAMASMSAALRPGGTAVLIMMHPCFRIPRQSSWGWDEQRKIQYRRLDRYASEMTVPIAAHPGADPSQHTLFYHRPLQSYLNALGKAGLAVTLCKELLSHRRSEPGGRSRAENRARDEFPVFIALMAKKLG